MADRRIFFVRHGETEWSLSGQHTGRTDIPLTANGQVLCRQLGQLLQPLQFAHVFTSPRLRARQTCDLVGLGDRAEILEDLAEWDYGEYEGLRSAEIRTTRPGWNIYRDGCPGGESPADIAARADRLIARLHELEGDTIVFSHGHFGTVIAARWIDVPVLKGEHFALGAPAVGVLSDHPTHPGVRVLGLWNARPGPAGLNLG